MFNKIKSVLMATTLERVKNIASVMTGLALTVLAGVFLYLTIYETNTSNIKVIGEAKIEIPEVKKFSIRIHERNANLVDEKIKKIEDSIKSEFNGFDLENKSWDVSKNFYADIIISFENNSSNNRFENFINDSFGDEVNLNSEFIKNKNFVVDESLLLEDALKNAESKAVEIASKSNRELGEIKNVDEDPYISSSYNDKKDDNFIIKKVEVTYKLK